MYNKINLVNKNNGIILGVSFIKWIFIGTFVGVITGSIAGLFLKILELATNLRLQYPWMLFFLPLGGAFVNFLYKNMVKIRQKVII